jgi:hypothetical protein
MFVLCLLLVVGCGVTPDTQVVPIDTSKPKVGKTITVGSFVDNRFPFWPRKEAHTPLKKGEEQSKDFEPNPVIKEVRIPMGEVRSRLAYTLKASGRFDEIINPPTTLTGDSLADMLKKTLETSDYLLVGEVNAFHIRGIGRNSSSNITLPIDLTLLGLPNLVAMLMSGNKTMILTGGMFDAFIVECYLTMSVTVYNVEAGTPVTTFRLETYVRKSVDSITAFGDLNNDDDDWVDLGRRLGEIALANACNDAIQELTSVVQQKESASKNKKQN